ncbi:hypothetical protein ABZS88_31595 [Streptomyces sp. NPDC005480]|uniref:hypothetical protein n=1 Tax=Streptomyces sp. NPDC005480 TaxID=3154880 RepID=UPI0033AA751E
MTSNEPPPAGRVADPGELVELLARFGMLVQVDEAAADSRELMVASPAHALVGAAEAHASRAEDAANRAGAGPADIGQAALMAFAGVGSSRRCRPSLLNPRGPGATERGRGHQRGRSGSCTTYLMGNHTIAHRVYTRDPAVLVAPQRTTIHEDRQGATWFSGDQPSTRFATFGNPDITKVRLELDAKLADLLRFLDIPVPPALTP